MAASAMTDTAKYAETLRANLMHDLFDGEVDLEDEDELEQRTTGLGREAYTVEDYIGSTTDALADVEADLESFADHDVIKGLRRSVGFGSSCGQNPLSSMHGSRPCMEG